MAKKKANLPQNFSDKLSMKPTIITYIKSTWNREALESLYSFRKALKPSEENRTKSALIVTTLLLVLVLGFLLFMASASQDMDSYINQRTNISFADQPTPWESSAIYPKSCTTESACLNQIKSASTFTPVDLATHSLKLPEKLANEDLAVAVFRTKVPASLWSSLDPQRSQVLTIPRFQFRRAHLFIDGQQKSSFLDSSWISWSFRSEDLGTSDISVEILFEITASQTELSLLNRPGLNRIERSLTAMNLGEQQAYLNQLALSKAGRAGFVGAIARVAMAVFVLALFLLIDGSPETLGLGLFLGFEAFAISLSYEWLPISNTNFLKHFCFQMGDIFRLYFFLQIARMADKRVGPWLFWGTLISIPYGLLRYYGPDFAILWPNSLPNIRDILVGGIGVIVCLRSAWYLKNKNLPWRVLALIIASVAAIEQCADPIGSYFPTFYNESIFQKAMNIIQPFSAWLFAFSAFINISTLENRVKTLSSMEARSKEMEREMELGRTVQQAFMHLPKIPDELNFACHHEAMLYVSGDTYFVDWNEQNKKLTFLVNDVTGHGVQAALKASGVSVIANTVWGDKTSKTWQSGKLELYAGLVETFLAKMNTEADVLAMGGCEFDLETGNIDILRINFPFPIIIEPKVNKPGDEESRQTDNWKVRILPTNSRQLTSLSLVPGSIVVLTSDGFLDNSRRTTDFLRYMRKNVATSGAELTTAEVKSFVLDCPHLTENKDNDDRTLTIFQWRPKSMPDFARSKGRDAA